MSMLLDVCDVGFSDHVGCSGEMIENYFPAEQISSHIDPDGVCGVECVAEKIHKRSVEE